MVTLKKIIRSSVVVASSILLVIGLLVFSGVLVFCVDLYSFSEASACM